MTKNPDNSKDYIYQSDNSEEINPSEDRQDTLDSVVERTRARMSEESLFLELVEFVRTARLPSKFSHENLSELVRYVLSKTDFESVPLDQEDCILWITNCFYDDPVSNQRSARLWSQIIEHIQANG